MYLYDNHFPPLLGSLASVRSRYESRLKAQIWAPGTGRGFDSKIRLSYGHLGLDRRLGRNLSQNRSPLGDLTISQLLCGNRQRTRSRMYSVMKENQQIADYSLCRGNFNHHASSSNLASESYQPQGAILLIHSSGSARGSRNGLLTVSHRATASYFKTSACIFMGLQ